MKKVFNFILLALCVISYSSCSNDEGIEYFNESSVKIVSRDITFPAAASQGSIVVEAPSAFTVTTSDQGWCTTTISGSTITVNVEQNPRLEGRSSMLTIHCGTDSTAVAIVQSGVVFKSNVSPLLISNDEPASFSYDIQCNAPLTFIPSADWISASIKEEKLVITLKENTTGLVRSGSLICSTGEFQKEININQYEFDKDLAGEYQLNFTEDGELQYFNAVLTRSGENYSIDLPSVGLSIPVSFNQATGYLSIKAGQYIGDFSIYKMFTGFYNTSTKQLTWSNSVSMSATFSYLEQNGTGYTVAPFEDDGSGGTFSPDALGFEAFSSTELSSSTHIGSLAIMISPYLLRSHAPKETVATMKAKSIKKTDLTLSYMK